MKPKNNIQIKSVAFIIAVLLLCAKPDAALSQTLKVDSVSPTLGEIGKSLNVTVNGSGFDQNTRVLMYPDIGNRKAIIGSVDTPGLAYGVAVSGTIVYIADADEGLQIIDISDPTNPKIIGSVDTPGYAKNITVSGATVYIADGNRGLQIINISDPANPKIIGSVGTVGYATDIAVSGATAYVATSSWYSGLQIINISNPANPKIIGSADMPEDAYGVAVSGTTAYVADGNSGLQVIDVSNPANPKIIGSVDTPGLAYGVAVSGTTAYIADADTGLQIIDISDPANPKIIGSADTQGEAMDVTVSGTTAYIADVDTGLQIIDISDPANPKIIGSVDTPGRAYGVGISGTTVYIADWDGLQVIDVSEPEKFQTNIGWAVTPGDAYGVTVSGKTVFVADGGSGLQIIDISDPTNPKIIGSADTPGFAYDVAVSGTTAYIADADTGLQIIDISDPANPKIIGSVGTAGYATDIVISGTTAYISGDSGLQIIDISNPVNPKIIGSADTGGEAMDVAVSGTTVYIAGRIGLQIIDISDPANPKIIGSVDTTGYAQGVAVSGTTVYIAAWSRGLQIIDVSDPAEPRTMASVGTPGAALDVVVSDGNVCVAAEGSGFALIPVTEITPVTVNSETSLSLTLPAMLTPGNYTLSISNKESHIDLKGVVTFAPPGQSQYVPEGQTLDEALRSKAIIVAGGGPGAVPDIWAETKLCADAAYRALRWRGYTDDDIYYLTWESDEKFPTDGIPSKSKIQYAVGTWAASGDAPSELLLYLVDHGGDGVFKVAPGEEVTVGDLDGWLDSLQNTMPGPVIFIYDACKSGTFLAGSDGLPRFAPPTGKERIAITSSSDEDAYFLYNGRLSFSYMFWQAVEDGEKLNQAFFFGRDMIGKQTPLLDANGNGKANEADDRSRAGRGLRRQYLKDSVKPIVENLSDTRQTLNGETSLKLSVRVNSENEITRVWAVIVPPDYSSEESSAVTDLPVAELQDSDKDGIYETNYTNLGTAGTYILTIYASDVNDYISLPVQMLVSQSKGTALSKPDSSEQGDDDTFRGADAAVINGGTVYHNFHEPWDADYVKFYALSGKTYQVRISSPSLICNVSIEIYGTDGLTKLTDTKDDGGSGEGEFLEWTCPENGVYYARINNADPDVFGANANYRLEVRTPIGPDTGKILLSFTDSVSGKPVVNAKSSFGDYSCVSGGDGNCEIIPQVGTYQLLADAEGYESFSPLPLTVDKGANNIVEKDIVLTPGKDITSLIGNIDGDGSVDLRDAILALQLSAGKTISKPLNLQADVNADGRIGIPESLYILREIAK